MISQRIVSFDTALPLIDFFDKFKPTIVGQAIQAIYAMHFYTHSTDENFQFIILENNALGVFFNAASEVSILLADVSDFDVSNELNDDGRHEVVFHSKLADSDDLHMFWDPICLINKPVIETILIDRHSDEIKSEYGYDSRKQGGDYFSSIRFILEGGYELITQYYGYEYTHISYSHLPKEILINGLQDIPLKLDPYHELWDLVEATQISPDELAQEAINFIERCTKAEYWSSEIAGLLRTFVKHGMNRDYVSENGDTILSSIPKLGPKSVYTLSNYLELK